MAGNLTGAGVGWDNSQPWVGPYGCALTMQRGTLRDEIPADQLAEQFQCQGGGCRRSSTN